MIKFKIDSLFWDSNESTGFRQVQVYDENRCFAVINSVRDESTLNWKANYIPMGFKLSTDEVEKFNRTVLPFCLSVMQLLECRTIDEKRILNLLENYVDSTDTM